MLCSGHHSFRRRTALIAVAALCGLCAALAGANDAQAKNVVRAAMTRFRAGYQKHLKPRLQKIPAVQRATKTAKRLKHKWKAGTEAFRAVRQDKKGAAHRAFSAIMGAAKRSISRGGKGASTTRANKKSKPTSEAHVSRPARRDGRKMDAHEFSAEVKRLGYEEAVKRYVTRDGDGRGGRRRAGDEGVAYDQPKTARRASAPKVEYGSPATQVEQEKRADSLVKRIAKFTLKKAGKAALYVALTPARVAAEFVPHALQPKVKAALGMKSSGAGVYGGAKSRIRARTGRKKAEVSTQGEAPSIVDSPHPGLRETPQRGLGELAGEIFRGTKKGIKRLKDAAAKVVPGPIDEFGSSGVVAVH